jgi:hypothetical protein
MSEIGPCAINITLLNEDSVNKYTSLTPNNTMIGFSTGDLVVKKIKYLHMIQPLLFIF